jgi:hypothetical protein
MSLEQFLWCQAIANQQPRGGVVGNRSGQDTIAVILDPQREGAIPRDGAEVHFGGLHFEASAAAIVDRERSQEPIESAVGIQFPGTPSGGQGQVGTSDTAKEPFEEASLQHTASVPPFILTGADQFHCRPEGKTKGVGNNLVPVSTGPS